MDAAAIAGQAGRRLRRGAGRTGAYGLRRSTGSMPSGTTRTNATGSLSPFREIDPRSW